MVMDPEMIAQRPNVVKSLESGVVRKSTALFLN